MVFSAEWKMLFFHLFNLLLVNVYVLYRKYGNAPKRRTQAKFRESLVHALVDSAVNAPLPDVSKGRRTEPLARLSGRHFPSYHPQKEGAKWKRPLRDFKACNMATCDCIGFKRKQTSFYCPKCVVSLCVPDCFENYHTKSTINIQ